MDHLNRQKLHQFHKRLNEHYNQIKSQNFLMSPIPSVNEDYIMIISEECQRSIFLNGDTL